MAVLRPWARLGVVLHRKYRQAAHMQPLIGAVEQRDVGRLDPRREAVGIDDKAVVLAGDLDLPGGVLLDRMVGAAMAAFRLEGAAAECQRQHLMAEADSEHRR